MIKTANRLYLSCILLSCFIPAIFLLMGFVDPTRPADVVETVKTSSVNNPNFFQLTAIYYKKNRSHVIINGEIKVIGDQMGEFTITAITPYTVELMGKENNKIILVINFPVKQLTH